MAPEQMIGISAPDIAKFLTVAFALATVLMVVFMTILHFTTQSRRRRIRVLHHQWRQAILPYIAGDISVIPAVIQKASVTQPVLLLHLLLKMGNYIQGSVRDNLKMIIPGTHLLTWMRKVANDRSNKRFPLVARAVTLFQIGELRESMLRHLSSPRDLHRINAAYAVARIAHPDDIEQLTSILEELVETRRDLVFVILSAFGQENPKRFVDYLANDSANHPPMRVILIEIVGSLRLVEAGPVIFQFLKTSKHPQLVVPSLLAAGELQLPEAHEIIHLWITDDNEAVRGAAAWALGRLHVAADADVLASLLEDRSWQVRLNAAAALTELGEKGYQHLRQVAEASPDPYARDMAQNALNNMRLGVPML
jgi:hypothetical protein